MSCVIAKEFAFARRDGNNKDFRMALGWCNQSTRSNTRGAQNPEPERIGCFTGDGRVVQLRVAVQYRPNKRQQHSHIECAAFSLTVVHWREPWGKEPAPSGE